jgi:hypothetical protein
MWPNRVAQSEIFTILFMMLAKNASFAGFSSVEPAGIEPATSCLQRASGGDPMWVRRRYRP